MKKRIKELAEQCTSIPNHLNPPVFDQEKFAELIVRECVSIVEDYGLSLVGSDENYLGETLNLSIKVQEAGNKIKQHFGVEE